MKKLTTILLALVMALALLPATVWAEDDAVAKAELADGTTKTYATLVEAVKNVKAGGTVTLLKDFSGAGIGTFRTDTSKPDNIPAKGFTIDFGGYTYTVMDPAQGSRGTETQGFHFEWSGDGSKNHNITMKNGTVKVAENTQNVKLLVMNYCDLTLENITLDGTNLVASDVGYYTLSNCCGTVSVKNSTIIAHEGGVAFDVDGNRRGYSPVNLTVDGGSVIKGKIEVSDGNTLSVKDGAFTDLATALKYAADNATIKLADDIAITDYVKVLTPVTVDLGNHKLTSAGGGFDVYANLTLKNGQMETLKWAAWVQNGAALVVEKDVTIKTTSTDANKGGITVQNTGSSVTMFGKVESVGTAISGIGNKDDGGVTINIEEGAVLTSTNGVGIYYPNTAVLNIKGGTITGLTGVYVKSGKTVVTGGTIIGTGAKADYEYYGNGCNSTGDAFVVDKCNYPGGDPVVEIKGGTFKSEKANAVASYVGNNATNALTGFISGGTFTSDPSAFAAEGYEASKDKEGNFTVVKPIPEKPGDDKPESPKTFDAGVAVYGMTAILSVTGMAWMGLKKRK